MKIWKRLFGTMLCLCLLCGLLPIAAQAAVTAGSTQEGAVILGSSVKAWKTGATSFNVNGVDGRKTYQTTFWDRGYETAVSVDGGTKQRNPSNLIAAGLRLDVDLEKYTDNYIKVQYTLTNSGARSHKVQIGGFADVMIDRNDRAPIYAATSGGNTLDMSGSPKNNYAFKLVATWSDTLWYGYYGSRYSNCFTDMPDRGPNNKYNGDSAVAYSWTAEVSPGETWVRCVLIGTGNLSDMTLETPEIPIPEDLIPDPAISLTTDEIYLTEGDSLPDWKSYIASSEGTVTTSGAPANSSVTGTYTVTYTAASNNMTATAELKVNILPKPAELSQTTVTGTGDFTLSAAMNYTGGLTWTETGFVYGVIAKPTLAQNDGTVKTGSAVSTKGGILSATVRKSSLVEGLQYYARAYAKASDGTVIYGDSSAYFGVGVPDYGTFSIKNNGNNTFTITRTGGSEGKQTVYYRTVNGSAVGGTHFTHQARTLTFNAGDTAKTVTITENTANTAYSNKPATAYSNADRTYSVEIYRVTGGANLGSTTSAVRTMKNDTSYEVARDYYTRYRNFAAYATEETRGDYDDDNLGWYKGQVGSAASRTITVRVPNLNADYWKSTATGLSYFMQVEIKEVADGYQHIQITPGSSINTNFYPKGGEYQGFTNFDDMNPAAYAMTLEHGGSGKLANYLTYSFPSGAKSGTVANARTPKVEYVKSGFSDGTGGLLFPVTQEQISIGYSASGSGSDKWMEKEENHFIKLLDTREPRLLAIAPMAGGTYFPGDSVTISLIFDEIVDSKNSSLTSSSTIRTSWGTFQYAGGADTNILYFTGTVPQNASSGTITLTKLTCASQIKDMSDGSGTNSSISGTPSTTVTVSKVAKPTVSVGTIANSNGALSSTITATKAVKLEYAWSESSALPSSGWTTSGSQSSVTVKTARGAGTYYLHARATNSDGVTATAYKSVTIPSSGASAAVSPELTVSVDNTDWAKTRGITVTRSPSNAAVTVKTPDGSTATVSSSSYTAKANGIYTFTLTYNGETVTRQALVSKIDTTAPVITINDLPDSSYTEQVTLTFSVTDGGSGVKTVTAKWGTAAAALTQNSDGTYSAACPNATGSYTLTVTAADNVGNSGTGTSKSYTVNLEAPTLTVTKTSSSNKGVTYSYSVNANGNSGVMVHLPDGTETGKLSGTFTLTEAGDYIVSVTDAAGHFVSKDIRVTGTVDGIAPDVRLYADDTADTASLPVTVEVYETGSAPTVRQDGSDLTVTGKGGGLYAGTFPVTAGGVYTVTAADASGNTGTASITVYALVDGSNIALKLADKGVYGELPTPTKTGYRFDGWYTAAMDGTKAETGDKVEPDYTLYARWTHTKHTNGAAVRENEVAATCTTGGSYDEVVYCTVCETEISREAKTTDPLGHDPEHHDAKAATCTETGWDAYDICKREGCGYTTYKEIPASGHTNGAAVKENEAAATCTTGGSYDEVVYCTVCETEISREAKTTDPLGHDPEHHDAKAATCTETGWAAYDTCKREGCGYTTYKDIPASGHTNGKASKENVTAATCTTDGSYDEVVYCTVCKTEIRREKKNIEALGHDVVHHDAKAATCTETGWDAYDTCKREGCGYTMYKEIPANGHSPGTVSTENEIAATCTTDGSYDEVTYCTVCNTETSRTHKTTAALGHDWGDWIETKPATEDAEGEKTRICKHDSSHTETVAIPKLGHTHSMTHHDAVAATCTETGNVEYWSCYKCGKNFEDEAGAVQLGSVQTEVNPSNHKAAAAWTQESGKHYHACENGCGAHLEEASCSGGTATCQQRAVCSVCNKEYGSLADHVPASEWSKDETGHWHMCQTEGCMEKLDFAAHNPDHDGGATEEYPILCTECGYEMEKKLSHTHSYDQEVAADEYKATDATCTSKATYYKSCACGEKGTETFAYGELAPHSYTDAVLKADALKAAGTCKDEAVYYYSCAACGAVERDNAHTFYGEKDAANHVDGTEIRDRIEADHKTQTNGYSGDTYCLGCNAKLSSGATILPSPHAESAGWQQSGTEHWKICSVDGCGTVLESTKAFHIYDDDADRSCNVCGYERTVHTCSGTLVGGQAASCTTDGWMDYYQCSCGKLYTTADCTTLIDDLEAWKSGAGRLAASGHDFMVQEYDDDQHWKKCSRCDAADVKEDHTGGTATCQQRAVCSVCGKEYGALASHDFDTSTWGYMDADGHAHCCQTSGCGEHDAKIPHTSSGDATEDSPEVCIVCGYVISPALGHTHRWTLVAEIPATCTQTGTAAHYSCDGCRQLAILDNETYVPVSEDDPRLTTPVNANNHTGALSDWQKNADGHWKEYSCCHVRMQEGGHEWIDATCTTPKTCSVCSAAEGSALGHNWQPATCEAPETCANCHVTRGEALGHDWGRYIVTTPATETSEGIETRTCARDASHTETRTIPKLPDHTYDDSDGSSYPPSEPAGTPDKKENDTGYRVCSRDSACPIWPFADAVPSAWYHDGVHYCVEGGLMQGVSPAMFLPDGSTTRAQLVTILWRLEGCPEADSTAVFSDVPDSAWYAKAVRWAAGRGIVKGYENGRFGADDAVTREQLTTILYRYAQYKGYDVSAFEGTSLLRFADAPAVSEYAVRAMQWACGSELVTGIAQDGGMFLAPKATTTRAQLATLMMRFQRAFAEGV